ncbi:MAG: Hsp33 family molecular chaperone HslO [Pseudomonadota bacterium]
MVSRQALGADAPLENMEAAFQLEGQPVRGRIVRLSNATLDPILRRHDYPDPIARLLGEALLLAVIVGTSLKFEGKLLVQAEGPGPITMLVAEYASNGDLRGYVRFDREKWGVLEDEAGVRPTISSVFGEKAVLGMIIIHDDPSMRPYQGVVPLTAPTLSACAEEYFERSEQVPTKIALGVGELKVTGSPPVWQGGGIILQRVAADDARGDTDDAWDTARILFHSVKDRELIDPDLSADQLLYRLFNEPGVRMEPAYRVIDACSCNEERLRGTLRGMPDASLRELVEADGTLSIDCQFCSRHYTIPLVDVVDRADG